MMKCICEKCSGWKNFKCRKWGGDIRGVWIMTSILVKSKNDKSNGSKKRI